MAHNGNSDRDLKMRNICRVWRKIDGIVIQAASVSVHKGIDFRALAE